jgi:hypothetical protein
MELQAMRGSAAPQMIRVGRLGPDLARLTNKPARSNRSDAAGDAKYMQRQKNAQSRQQRAVCSAT